MTDRLPLPKFEEPASLADAKARIVCFGTSIHEHAYILGKILLWAQKKTKAQGVRGVGFGAYVETNFWFSEGTARNYIRYAAFCERAGYLLFFTTLKADGTAVVVKRNPNRAQRPALAAPEELPDSGPLPDGMAGLLADYFPEAWSLATPQRAETLIPRVEPRRQKAFKKIVKLMRRDHLALLFLGLQLANALPSQKSAAA